MTERRSGMKKLLIFLAAAALAGSVSAAPLTLADQGMFSAGGLVIENGSV